MKDDSTSEGVQHKSKMRNFIKQWRQRVEGRRVVVDILAILFGIGTWVGINGMFVQLPLLVKTAPEGWNLPSYMSVAVQIANLGPLVYAILRKIWPQKLNDAYCIYVVLFIGLVAATLVPFLYDYTTDISGEPRSTVFLILVFSVSIVGCTSSVLFFPFMRHFKEIYLISYLIGEGLSGFLPSIVALIQGIGGNPECVVTLLPDGNTTLNLIYKEPLFGTSYFFGFIAIAMLFSFCAFFLLNNLKVCQYERVPTEISKNNTTESVDQKCSLTTISSKAVEESKEGTYDTISIVSEEHKLDSLSILRSTSLLILMSAICALSNGVFPSIQSYSCLPYGNTAYHLAITLSSMANPVACFLAVFLPHTTNRWISVLTSLCAVCISYVMATSILSPAPPLVDSVGGVVLVVSHNTL